MSANFGDAGQTATVCSFDGIMGEADPGSTIPHMTSSISAKAVINARQAANINALPLRAKATELAKVAYTFASSGKNMFVHYTRDVLEDRRSRLLNSGTARKLYTKKAPSLWDNLEQEQKSFWHETAMDIRLAMKQKLLTPEDCLQHAGRLEDARRCIWYAELAVSAYLGTPPPASLEGPTATAEIVGEVAISGNNGEEESSFEDREKMEASSATICITTINEKLQRFAIAPAMSGDINVDIQHPAEAELLDTLPDRFEYTQNMLYSHFARYDLDDIRNAEGREQTAMLRLLASLLDISGKELCYYYVVPRLCKAYHPPRDGSTVMSMAADVWRFLPGRTKDLWASASRAVKKQLGDGDVGGVEMLQLDSLEPEVLRLHEMAQEAMKSHASR